MRPRHPDPTGRSSPAGPPPSEQLFAANRARRACASGAMVVTRYQVTGGCAKNIRHNLGRPRTVTPTAGAHARASGLTGSLSVESTCFWTEASSFRAARSICSSARCVPASWGKQAGPRATRHLLPLASSSQRRRLWRGCFGRERALTRASRETSASRRVNRRESPEPKGSRCQPDIVRSRARWRAGRSVSRAM
jgi:hypothetical protein